MRRGVKLFPHLVRGLQCGVSDNETPTHAPMNSRLRQERINFLLFLGAAYMSLMCALPIITASLSLHYPNAPVALQQPTTFEQLDRNRDGYVDRAEALEL